MYLQGSSEIMTSDNIHFAFRVTAASPWLVLTTWECVHPNACQRNPLSSEGQLANPALHQSCEGKKWNLMKFETSEPFDEIRSFCGPSWRKHSEGVAEGPNKSSARQLSICYAPDWPGKFKWMGLSPSRNGSLSALSTLSLWRGLFSNFQWTSMTPLKIGNIWWGATNSACLGQLKTGCKSAEHHVVVRGIGQAVLPVNKPILNSKFEAFQNLHFCQATAMISSISCGFWAISGNRVSMDFPNVVTWSTVTRKKNMSLVFSCFLLSSRIL